MFQKKWQALMVIPLLISFSISGLAQTDPVSGTIQEVKKLGAEGYQLTLLDGKNTVVFWVTDSSLIQKTSSAKDLKKGQTILPAVAPQKKGGGGGNFKGLKMPFSNMSAMQRKMLGLPDLPTLPAVPNTADMTGNLPKIPKLPKVPKAAPKAKGAEKGKGAANEPAEPAEKAGDAAAPQEEQGAQPDAKAARQQPTEVKPKEDTMAKLISKPISKNNGEEDPLLFPKKVLDIKAKGQQLTLKLEGANGRKSEDLVVTLDAQLIQVLNVQDLKKGMKVSLEAAESEGRNVVKQLVIL